MADTNRSLLSTCPICGYTDSSTDSQALSIAIEQHMREAHNMDAASMQTGPSIKPGSLNSGIVSNEPPAAAPVANLGNAPSAAMAAPNIGHNDHGGAPGDPETEARDPYAKD